MTDWIPIHADGTDCPHGADPDQFEGQLDAYADLGVPAVSWTPPTPRCRAGLPLRGVRDSRVPPPEPEPAVTLPGPPAPPAAPAGFRHAEAYCVMRYLADDGTDEEYVYNSRDGVTPFVIRLRSGKTASHVDWSADRRMPPGWQPPPGMRVFTDLTPARARAHAERNVDAWLADPEGRRRVGNREVAIAGLAESYLAQPGAPDLIDPREVLP